jgi:hypothetical protein
MWDKREWILFSVAVLLCALFTKAGYIGPNDKSRVAGIESVVERGTFAIDDSPFNATIDRELINGKFYSNKPPASYLVMVPAYYALYKMGFTFVDRHRLVYYWVTLLTLGLSVSAMLVYFYRFLRRYKLSKNERMFYSFAVFMTLVFPYALAINNHSLAAAYLFFSYYLLANAKNAKQYWLAGLMAGLTAAIDLPLGLFPLFFTVMLLAQRAWKNTFWYAFGVGIPTVISTYINYVISGSIIPITVRAEFFNFPGSPFANGSGVSGLVHPTLSQMLTYAWGITLGSKGFFIYTPVLLFSFAGLLFTVFTKNKYRREAIAILFGILATFLFYIAKTDNYGGCNYGFRFTVPLIPILFAFTPALFAQKSVENVKTALHYLFWIAVALTAFYALCGAILHPWTCDLSMTPHLAPKEFIVRLFELTKSSFPT